MQAVFKTRTRAPQMGHLFCDMKDFTRRTAFLKETVIADFLSREFYGPILTAAARQHGKDQRGRQHRALKRDRNERGPAKERTAADVQRVIDVMDEHLQHQQHLIVANRGFLL